MILIIYFLIILASFLEASNENIKSYAIKYIPKSLYNSCYFSLSAILLTILWWFQDRENMTLKKLLNLDSNQILFIIAAGLIVTGISYSVIQAYSLNNKLKNPINIGILGGILTLQFVFTFAIDILIKTYQKKQIIINPLEITGMVLILFGVIITIYSRIK